MLCNKCGTMNSDESGVCVKCGALLNNNQNNVVNENQQTYNPNDLLNPNVGNSTSDTNTYNPSNLLNPNVGNSSTTAYNSVSSTNNVNNTQNVANYQPPIGPNGSQPNINNKKSPDKKKIVLIVVIIIVVIGLVVMYIADKKVNESDKKLDELYQEQEELNDEDSSCTEKTFTMGEGSDTATFVLQCVSSINERNNGTLITLAADGAQFTFSYSNSSSADGAYNFSQESTTMVYGEAAWAPFTVELNGKTVNAAIRQDQVTEIYYPMTDNSYTHIIIYKKLDANQIRDLLQVK